MAVLTYATATDLQDGWLSTVPDNAAVLIRHASLLVDKATRMDCYDTDDTGAPTDPKLAETFRDATCQQVASWVAAGLDPEAGAVGRPEVVVSQSTEGDSVTYAPGPTTVEIARATETLCQAALLILQSDDLGSRMPRML